jgi:hypothetical protein
MKFLIYNKYAPSGMRFYSEGSWVDRAKATIFGSAAKALRVSEIVGDCRVFCEDSAGTLREVSTDFSDSNFRPSR